MNSIFPSPKSYYTKFSYFSSSFLSFLYYILLLIAYNPIFLEVRQNSEPKMHRGILRIIILIGLPFKIKFLLLLI